MKFKLESLANLKGKVRRVNAIKTRVSLHRKTTINDIRDLFAGNVEHLNRKMRESAE